MCKVRGGKIRKFYPFYFVFVIVGLFIHRGTWYQLIENIFLVQSYFGTFSSHSFNPPTWFLSSIMLSYFLAPVINKVCHRTKKYINIILMFLCLMVQMALAIYFTGSAESTDFGNYILYTFPPVRMIEFIEGVLLSLLFKSKEQRFFSLGIDSITVIEAFFVLIYLFLLAIADAIPTNYKLTVIWVIPSMALVWLFAGSKGRITSWCSNNKLLQYLGKRSYELYIAHRLVLWFFAFHSREFMGTLLPFIIILIVVEAWGALVNLWKSKKHTNILRIER